MKTKTTRFISIILLSLCFLTTLVACKNETGSNDPLGSATPPIIETTEGQIIEEIPAVVDCDDYEFIILCKDNELWFEMYANETGSQTGDAISDALYTREIYIEDLYNCNVTLKKDSKADEKVRLNASSDEHIADALYTTGKLTLTLAKTGTLRNVLDIPELRLSNSYWDQNIQKEYRIGKALYCLEGDINIRDDLRTMQVTINKTLYEKYGLNETYGDIYKLVTDYEWTFDKMVEMTKDRYEDPDDNGQSMQDTYGVLMETTAPYYFFLGSGIRPVVTVDNVLVSCLEDPLILEAADKAISILDNNAYCMINSGSIKGVTDTWPDAITIFKNDQTLFRSSALSSVNGYIDMTSEYGILPIPMMFDTNERYYCWVSSSNHYPLSIPYNGVEDISKTAIIIEAMAYYSKYLKQDNYNEAFYERLADFRLGQTPEDVEMLDIIFESKTYELDQPLVITGFENQMWNRAKARSTSSMASVISAYRDRAKYNAEQTQSDFAKIEQ